MKEEDIKQLIQKSKVETSEDFINHLMQRIDEETQPSVQTLIGISFRRLLAICVGLMVLISFLGYFLMGGLITDTGFEMKGLATPLLVIVFGVMLFVLNNFIRTMEASSA